jgi:hypothetical protein
MGWWVRARRPSARGCFLVPNDRSILTAASNARGFRRDAARAGAGRGHSSRSSCRVRRGVSHGVDNESKAGIKETVEGHAQGLRQPNQRLSGGYPLPILEASEEAHRHPCCRCDVFERKRMLKTNLSNSRRDFHAGKTPEGESGTRRLAGSPPHKIYKPLRLPS